MLILIPSCAKTPATSESRQEGVHWIAHTFREVTTLRALPPGVQTALGAGKPGLDGIADRHGIYNSTDVVYFDFPTRRFLVAGLASDATLVAVEHGGRGWNVEVTLFSDIGGKAAVQQTWTLFESPRTLRDLVDRLSKHEAKVPEE
jgi:hypothetical protein